MKRICVQITDHQYELLKKESKEGLSIAFLVRQALENFYQNTIHKTR